MKTFIVYKAEYRDKVYIGYTNSRKGFKRRKYEHYINAESGKQSKFYNALRKYGDKFKWSIIEQDISSKTLAKEKEVYYINEYDSFTNGYNSTLGGDGGKTWDSSGKNNPQYVVLDDETVKELIESYSNGENISNISKRLGLTIGKARRTLKENSIELRPGANLSPEIKENSIKNQRLKRKRKRKDNYDKSGKNNPRYVELDESIEPEVKHLYESGSLNKKQIMETFGFGKRVLERIFKKYNIKKYYVNEK